MPITAETFRSEHFEHLIRGIEAARGALQLAEAARDEARGAQEALAKENIELQEELEARPSVTGWAALVELIEDVGRGVHTLDELLAHVRAL